MDPIPRADILRARDALERAFLAGHIRFSGEDADLEKRIAELREGCGACHDGAQERIAHLEAHREEILAGAQAVKEALSAVGYVGGAIDVVGEKGDPVGTLHFYERTCDGIVQFVSDRDLYTGDWRSSLYQFSDTYRAQWHAYLARPERTFFGGRTVIPKDRLSAAGCLGALGAVAGGLIFYERIYDVCVQGTLDYLALAAIGPILVVAGGVAGYLFRGKRGYLDGKLVFQGGDASPHDALLAALEAPMAYAPRSSSQGL